MEKTQEIDKNGISKKEFSSTIIGEIAIDTTINVYIDPWLKGNLAINPMAEWSKSVGMVEII